MVMSMLCLMIAIVVSHIVLVSCEFAIEIVDARLACSRRILYMFVHGLAVMDYYGSC